MCSAPQRGLRDLMGGVKWTCGSRAPRRLRWAAGNKSLLLGVSAGSVGDALAEGWQPGGKSRDARPRRVWPASAAENHRTGILVERARTHLIGNHRERMGVAPTERALNLG